MAVVKIYRSSVPGRAPSSLAPGQVAINDSDGIFYWLDANGTTIRSFNFLVRTVTTQPLSDSSTLAANTAFVQGIAAQILGDPPPTDLSTLTELAAAINNDPDFYLTLNDEIVVRVRYDAAQTLNGTQLAQVQANIGLDSNGILNSIKTVDGVGSGLDADLLDSHDSSYFKQDAGEEGAI